MTSHDVVAVCRRQLGERRVGHAGTLDPDATGVLLVGVGSVTRLHALPERRRQELQGEVVLGVETATLDAAGAVTARHEMAVTPDEVRRAVDEHLVGPIEQVPPMVSALKVGGRRLHELAREGIEVERAARPVTVHRFDGGRRPTTRWCTASPSTAARAPTSARSPPISGTCSAAAPTCAGCGARPSARSPRRRPARSMPSSCSPRAAPSRDLEAVTVDAATATRIAHGALLDRPAGTGPWAVLDPDGALLAVYEGHGDRRRQTCRRAVRRVASATVQVITDAAQRPWAEPHRRHHRGLRRRPPRPPGRHRRGASHRRRAQRPLGRGHLRPPPGGRSCGPSRRPAC